MTLNDWVELNYNEPLKSEKLNELQKILKQIKLQKVAISIIANNMNLFTFQKYTEISILNEVPELDADGIETGEFTTTISIQYIDNEFICDKIPMSFEEMMMSFLSENTGFSVVKSLINTPAQL